MHRIVHAGTGGGAERREKEKAAAAETARQAAAEGGEPDPVEEEMGEAAVQQGVGEWRPELGPNPARQAGRTGLRRIADRNEGEEPEQQIVLPGCQQVHPDEMDRDHHDNQDGHCGRHVEQRLARRTIGQV